MFFFGYDQRDWLTDVPHLAERKHGTRRVVTRRAVTIDQWHHAGHVAETVCPNVLSGSHKQHARHAPRRCAHPDFDRVGFEAPVLRLPRLAVQRRRHACDVFWPKRMIVELARRVSSCGWGLPCASGDELVSLGFRVGNPSAIGWHQQRIFQHPC
jgi:hypothetical protein